MAVSKRRSAKPAGVGPSKESPLLSNVRLAVGSRRDCTFWRINSGVYFAMFGTKDARKLGRVRSAPTGFPDLIGLQRRVVTRHKVINANSFNPVEQTGPFVYGQLVAIETKARDGVQSKEQIACQAEIERLGGIYILARSVDDVLAVLGPDMTP